MATNLKKIAVICDRRSTFEDWLRYGKMNGIDKSKFVFVNHPQHVVGLEFCQIVTIGEDFENYSRCIRAARTRLR